MRPHLSPEMLAKRAQFKHNTIQTEDGVFSAVSLCFFFLLCEIVIYEIFQSMGAPIPVLSLWMHAWAKLPWCDWKAFPRQQPVPIEVNSMCHDKPNDCTNHTQVSNKHACVCTWNREDSDQLLFWKEPLLNPVDVLSVNWKPQLADRNLSNQVRHHCLSFL